MVPSVILFLCAWIPVLWAIYPMGLGVGAAVICLFLLGLVLRKPGLLCLAFFFFVGFAIYALAPGHFVLALISVPLGLSAWDLGNLSIWSKNKLPRPAIFLTSLLSLGLGAVGALFAILGKNLTLSLSSPWLFLLGATLWLILWLLKRAWG